jgi:hypothetical protein
MSRGIREQEVIMGFVCKTSYMVIVANPRKTHEIQSYINPHDLDSTSHLSPRFEEENTKKSRNRVSTPGQLVPNDGVPRQRRCEDSTNHSMVRDEAILRTRELRDDLRYPSDDLGRLNGDPVFVRIVSREPGRVTGEH